MLFKKKTPKSRSMRVFASEENRQIILAPMHRNLAGILYEQEDCHSFDLPINRLKLGEEIIRCLQLFSMKDKNLRDIKPSEWPSFQKSKCKTIKSFEFDYAKLEIIENQNFPNILEVSGYANSNSSEIFIRTSVNTREPIKVGDRINKMIECCFKRTF